MEDTKVEDKLRKVLKEDREKERERKANERKKRAEDREKEHEKKTKAKPLNVDEVANWGAQILESIPFVTIEDTGELWTYLGDKHGYYISRGEVFLKKQCATCGDNRACDPGVLRRLIMKIKGSSYKKRIEFIHPEGLINLKDGVFDLNQEKLLEHNHEYYFKGVLNVIYDKSAKCPVWEKSIRDMVVDEENYFKFQKWTGYHFVRGNIEQKALGLFGISKSGKSKSLMILRDLLGKENVTNFELQDFTKSSSYSLGRLYGKLANISFDMSQMPIKDITVLKKLISGDPITARNIYEAPFELVNGAKITWACNKFPYIEDNILSSREFQRRILLIETRIGYESEDKNIYNKYLSELHTGGIFNWMVEGYKLYKKEGFKDEDIYSKWKDNMDTDIVNSKKGHRIIGNSDELNDIFGM